MVIWIYLLVSADKVSAFYFWWETFLYNINLFCYIHFFPFFFYNAVNEHFFQVMGTCFCGNFHVNSLLCHSQTLRDSCCSSLCLVHRWFKDPSNLVYKLIIIALIWNNWSPFQFSKCRNIHVKTITIDWCNHNPGLWTLDFFRRIDLEFRAD